MMVIIFFNSAFQPFRELILGTEWINNIFFSSEGKKNFSIALSHANRRDSLIFNIIIELLRHAFIMLLIILYDRLYST